MVLSREQLRENALILGSPSFEEALQPNGFDLTVDEIHRFGGEGWISLDDKQLPTTTPVPARLSAVKRYEHLGSHYTISSGAYLVTFNEEIQLPPDIMAYLRPRSTLLRMGAAMHTAVWDAGYHGRGSSLLVVYNHHSIRISRGARVAQMVFHRLERATQEGYAGSYQGEGIERMLQQVESRSYIPDNAMLYIMRDDDARIDNQIRRIRERLDP